MPRGGDRWRGNARRRRVGRRYILLHVPALRPVLLVECCPTFFYAETSPRGGVPAARESSVSVRPTSVRRATSDYIPKFATIVGRETVVAPFVYHFVTSVLPITTPSVVRFSRLEFFLSKTVPVRAPTPALLPPLWSGRPGPFRAFRFRIVSTIRDTIPYETRKCVDDEKRRRFVAGYVRPARVPTRHPTTVFVPASIEWRLLIRFLPS